MIDWSNFGVFFKTGIPSGILYTLIIIAIVAIGIGLSFNWVNNKRRFVLWVFLAEYAFIVICSTIICRSTPSFEYAKLELMPFWTYLAVIKHTPGVSIWDIVLNIVLFVPLGFLVKLLYPSLSILKMMGVAILCSLLIEINQYVFEKGIAQIDDVMHNTTGAMVGWCMACLIVRK